MIQCLVREIYCFGKIEFKVQALFLFFVDVGYAIAKGKISLESKKRSNGERLIASAHIVLVKLETVNVAVEIVFIVLPPFIKISIIEIELRRWDRVPSFIHFH